MDKDLIHEIHFISVLNSLLEAIAPCREIQLRLHLVHVFQGCLKGFENYLKKHLLIVGGVGIGLAFIQVSLKMPY